LQRSGETSGSPSPERRELMEKVEQAILKVMKDHKVKTQQKSYDKVKSLMQGAILSLMRNFDIRNKK
jgi:hypothetical protein